MKLVAVVPAEGDSYIPFPPALDMGSPDWVEVMNHMGTRLQWADPTFEMDVIPDDTPREAGTERETDERFT